MAVMGSAESTRWMQEYTQWLLPRMQDLFVREKLHVTVHRIVRGPMTLNVDLSINPSSINRNSITTLLAMDDVLAQICQSPGVRIEQKHNGFSLEIALPQPVCITPKAADLLAHTTGESVCVGITSTKQPVKIALPQHAAIMWVGPTRSGKTQSMKSTLYGVLGKNVRYVILSQKVGDWLAFDNQAESYGVVSSAEETKLVGDWMIKELDDRAANRTHDHRVIIVADDLINLLERDPSLGTAMGAVASMGAGLGMHLFMGTQEAGSKRSTGGGPVEANVTARIMYRMSNASVAARSAGQANSGLAGLSGNKGDGLLIAHGQQVRIATGWIADDTTIGATGKMYEKPWYNRPQNHVVASRTTDSNQLKPTPPPNTAKVAETGGGSVKPVVAQPVLSFPITRRELTDNEVAEVMRLSADGASKNKLCFIVYGQKDGMTMGFINNALARGVTAGC